MTVRKGTHGSGLTEKASYSWDGDADESAPEIAAILETGTLDGLIGSIERACFTILVEAGLPGEHGCFAYKKSGDWKPLSPGDFMSGWGIANTVETISKTRDIAPDSPVGFAAAMMDRIYWIRNNQARGDHARAALFAFYLGSLRAESRIKLDHERVWTTGKKIHGGGDAARNRPQADRVAAVEALTTGPDPISKREAFKAVAESEGVTAKAIETDYYKAKKDRPKPRD